MKVKEIFELKSSYQKSFYGKAKVAILENGDEVLYSYGTPIIYKDLSKGKAYRLWDDWSATTGKHIAEFIGLNKKAYQALEYRKIETNYEMEIEVVL